MLIFIHLWGNLALAKVKSPSSEEIKDSIEQQLKALNSPPQKTEQPPSVQKNDIFRNSQVPSTSDSAPLQKTKINVNLNLERATDAIKLTLTFEQGTPYYAVFCRGTTYYITLAYPADSKITKWKKEDFPELRHLDVLSNEDAFSYKLKFSEKLYPHITYNNHKNTITVIFDKSPAADEGLPVKISQPRSKDDPFQVKVSNGQANVDFYDSKTGHTLWVICGDYNSRPTAFYSYPQFDILESYQGIAFLLRSEDLSYSYAHKFAEINQDNGLANSFSYTPISKNLDPPIFSGFNQEHAKYESDTVLKKLTIGNPQIGDGLYLMWLYLGQGLGIESSDIATQLAQQTHDLKLAPYWQALSGLADIMRYHYETAVHRLSAIKNEPDVDFWHQLAVQIQYTYMDQDTSNKLINYKDRLLTLPIPIQERLRNDLLEIGIANQNKPILMAYGTSSSPPIDNQYLPMYTVALAVFNLNPAKPDSVDALTQVINQYRYSRAAILAAFERLKFLRATKKIDVTDELKQLDRLRYIWRGDLLEYSICTYLAKRYMQEHLYEKALPLLRKTIKYFTKQAHKDKLPQEMQQALLDYFEQKSPPVLQMLSIFQDYMSIAPDDEHGDAIMLKATNTLANLGLYDQAIGLLEQYLEQKVKEGSHIQERKNKIYYRLAVASILNNEPEKTLNYIDDLKDSPPHLIDDCAILKAEAYLKLKEFDKAIQSLGTSPAQLFHKGGIYFGVKNWQDSEKIFHDLCYTVKDVPPSIKESSIIDLALCYIAQDDKTSLAKLHKDFGKFMNQRKGQQTFNLLTQPEITINPTQLTNLTQVDSFAAQLKSVFSDSK